MKKGESRKGTKEMSKIRPVCNYWVEYWDTDTDQWICKLQSLYILSLY